MRRNGGGGVNTGENAEDVGLHKTGEQSECGDEHREDSQWGGKGFFRLKPGANS